MKTGISDMVAMVRSALLLALITAAVSLFYPGLLSGAFAADAMPGSLSTDTAPGKAAADGAKQAAPAGTASTGAGQTAQEASSLLPVLIVVLFWVLVVVGAAVFVWLFSGAATPQKAEWMIRFCYAIAAFVVFFSLTLVFFPVDKHKSQQERWPEFSGPVGIILGCSDYPRAPDIRPPDGETDEAKDRRSEEARNRALNEQKWVPREIACGNNTTQWLVNFGGKVLHPRQPPPAPCKPLDESCEVSVVKGGMVVPLYFVIVSLFGALVSLTRRVPEFQGRLGANTARPLTPEEAREFLVFQIMQLVSAPLLASAAYYLIDPGSRAGSIGLAFTAGFSSETILLAIRTLVTKLAPAGSAALSAIVVTPDKVDFGEHTIGKKPRETVTLTNRSGATVNVSRIDTSGDFAVIAPGQTFPFAIAAGSTCKLNVEFTPKTEGGCSGNITVTDDGVGSPRVIALVGKGGKATNGAAAGDGAEPQVGAPEGPESDGAAPADADPPPPPADTDPNALARLQLSSSTLSFGSQPLNTPSSSQTLRITHAGSEPIEVRIDVSPEFDSVPKGTVLLGPDEPVEITFTPGAAGDRTGTLTISAAGSAGALEVTLGGSGT